MKIGVIILIAVVVLICEIVSNKQRAEIDNKIEDIHYWLRKTNYYKYGGYSTNEDNKTSKEIKQDETN